jgi:hypothetical protein
VLAAALAAVVWRVLAGLPTSTDLMLRVLAASIEPAATPISPRLPGGSLGPSDDRAVAP